MKIWISVLRISNITEGVKFMPVKPVDYQVMIPKMSEVSKISNDAQQKSLVLKQQDNVKLQEKIDNSLKQVYEKEDVQHGRIGEKQKKQEKDLSEKNKKKKNKESRSNRAIKEQSGIDIRI